MTIVIFTGPTLSADDVLAEVDAVCLPPVSQGDVYRAALQKPQAIGIIDGYFERVPSVWHKEILWAMTQGVHVYGSASMGALRAAELSSFGMEGVGEIYQAYQTGVLEDDDEVAVRHGPADSGYRCLSEAMVNVRATLARAEREKVLSAKTRVLLEILAKNTFYPERSYPQLLRQAATHQLPPTELTALAAWLPTGQVNLKRQDALAMLRLMRERLADARPKHVSFRLEQTFHWHEAMAAASVSEGSADGQFTMLTAQAVLEELRLNGADYRQAREKAMLRDLALREAHRRGYRTDGTASQKMAQKLCPVQVLRDPEAFERWLEANALTRRQFEQLSEEEALVQMVLTDWNLLPVLLAHLRVSGTFTALRQRALDKQRRLEAASLKDVGPADVGVTEAALLQWHFRRLDSSLPVDLARYALDLGFESVETFLHAVLRDYCHERLKASATTDPGASG